ncbi:MAG: hypothetical protein R2826_07965 [Thermoleophilia bacterium]
MLVRSIGLKAPDAGTEVGSELAAYVPGPPFGGTLRDETHDRIEHHDGISGIGDADPAVFGWRGLSGEADRHTRESTADPDSHTTSTTQAMSRPTWDET